MTPSERRWCWAYALVLAVLTSLPPLLGFATQGEAWRFTGFVFGVEDGNSYLAKMLQGASGAWLFRTPYTAQEQRGVLAFLPYLLLGKMAGGTGMHEQLAALFHIARIAAIPAVVLATHRFLGHFIQAPGWRRWGTVLATAGGGLGWLLVALARQDWLGSLPLDLHSPESFGFLALYGLPHLGAARALLLLGLCLYLEARERPRRAWAAGAAWLLLGLAQPLTVLVGYAVLGAHLCALALRGGVGREAEVRAWLPAAGRALALSAPLVLYTAAAFATDPFLRGWTAQNRIPSPHPAHYLAAYALVLIPAAWGASALLRSRRAAALLPVAWVALLPLLAYAPVNVQRRLPEGLWVALIALAAVGLASAANTTRARRTGAIVLAFSLPSTLLLLAGGVEVARRPAAPAFVPAEAAQAFGWLAGHAEPGSVVLATYATANALPAWAPVRVPAGHGPESVGLEQVLPQVEAFFRGELSGDAWARLRAGHSIDYVLEGPLERASGGAAPEVLNGLMRVFDSHDYTIYRVP